jgi:Zn-dependent protease
MTPDGIAIARLFGIEIRISLAWAVLIAIITILGAEQATVTTPELSGALQWVIGGAVAAAFLVSVVAHELAHALVARRRGVRSTVIVLGFIGGLAPLSVQARRPADELAIAVVGPLLSLVLAFVIVPLGVLVGDIDRGLGAIAGGMIIVGGLNLVLAVVSLLPGLPLDGGRIVRALAWSRTGDLDRATKTTARIGRTIGWLTMGVGVAIAFMDRTAEGLLVLSLGWLLSTGARTLDRRLGLEQLLRGVPVREAMDADAAWVGPHLTIDTFASRYEGEDAVSALAVVDDDRVVGVLGVQRLKRLGRRKFAGTRVSDVMATPPQAPVLAPDDDLWAALDVINQSGLDALAVAEDGRLAGLLTRRSLGKAVQTLLAARQGAAG